MDRQNLIVCPIVSLTGAAVEEPVVDGYDGKYDGNTENFSLGYGLDAAECGEYWVVEGYEEPVSSDHEKECRGET